MLERHAGSWRWTPVTEIPWVVRGNQLHLAVPRDALGLTSDKGPLRFHFKWADHVPDSGNILDFVLHGDTAPNGRFQYGYEASQPKTSDP